MMQVGDRCADEGLYEAAKLLFVAIDDYPGLALCLIKLKDYQGAADAAKKSGAIKSYKEVSSATVLHDGRCSLARVCVCVCSGVLCVCGRGRVQNRATMRLVCHCGSRRVGRPRVPLRSKAPFTLHIH